VRSVQPARGAGIDSERRAALNATKLAALVRDHMGDTAPIERGVFTPGAGVVRAGEAWVLADERPGRALGPALAWARQKHAKALHVCVDDAGVAGVLARRATAFAHPITVWRVVGRTLQPAAPEPFPAAVGLDPRVEALRPLIVAGGALPVVEHGVLAGEVRGLEVCRVVIDTFTDTARLEVGVGAHDREAFGMIHGGIPTEQALADVVRKVAFHRRPGERPHPLNQLAKERAMRADLVADPSLIGLDAPLVVAEPPVVRPNLKDAVPCVAVSAVPDPAAPGVVVVCSSGIDLDVVPFAADARLALGVPEARLVIVVPARDDHPVTRALASLLVHPAEVRVLEVAGGTP
jgi:hypothetical protein